MKIPFYQVDAFVHGPFTGNPAGVCLLDRWLDDATMQNIALENQLSETAFMVRKENSYELRWFTPQTEVELCGHATLASAHVLFTELGIGDDQISFETRSGRLGAARVSQSIQLDFPSQSYEPETHHAPFNVAVGVEAIEVCRGGDDVFLVVSDQKTVKDLNPDFSRISTIKARGVIVTARGETVDFVSRFFGPNVGVNEDPVTGSAHCTLAPYWAHKLQKNRLVAHQLSVRGGEITCELRDNRVYLSGICQTFLVGFLLI